MGTSWSIPISLPDPLDGRHFALHTTRTSTILSLYWTCEIFTVSCVASTVGIFALCCTNGVSTILSMYCNSENLLFFVGLQELVCMNTVTLISLSVSWNELRQRFLNSSQNRFHQWDLPLRTRKEMPASLEVGALAVSVVGLALVWWRSLPHTRRPPELNQFLG